MDKATLDTLFNFKDHQNVPKAINLLSALYKLSKLPKFVDEGINQSLVLLGQLIGFLITPYTDSSMCLTDQLISLSAAGHLLLVLYRHNRTSFCPGQFYYDAQSFIKATFWYVAKQKVLNPAGSFYIIQTGSDRLENNFGIYRTMDHSHNVDILQLSHRASQAAEVLRIFADNPEIDRGHRRLNLQNVEGVDHTNPRSWTGDVTVNSVSLLSAWNTGRRKAQQLLQSLKIPFQEFSALPANVDLLRPFGDFVGLREDNDDGKSKSSAGLSTKANMSLTTSALPPIFETSDADAVLIDAEDQLPELGDDDLDLVQKTDSFWLEIDGKSVHKASAVRFLLYSEEGRKSTDRPSRAAGMKKIRSWSRYPSPPSLEDDFLVGNQFMLNQLVATFIRTNDVVSLAIIQVSGIKDAAGNSVSSIDSSALLSHDVNLQGQVLTLIQRDGSSWVWNGSFESFTADKKPSAASHIASKKSSVLDFPAAITQAVKARYEKCNDTSGLMSVFGTAELNALSIMLWDRVQSFAASIASKNRTATYPSRDKDGELQYIIGGDEPPS